MDQLSTTTPWWGDFDYADAGLVRSWEMASLQLWVQRVSSEWRLTFRDCTDSGDDTGAVMGQVVDGICEEAEQERYLYRSTPDTLRVRAALAPRPVVVRPVTPLRIPAGERVSLYVTTPLWMQFCSGDSSAPFRDLAIVRPSDTWFGSDTRNGQICYAARAPGQLELDQLQRRVHQAITCIDIDNRADDLLEFDRISLPVAYLSLYADRDNLLWTEKVTFLRDSDGDIAQLDIDEVPPRHLARATLVARPREKAPVGLLVRTFNALFA